MEGARRRLPRFLRERVDDDNALSNRGHVDGASNAALPFHAHLPEFPVEVLDVRFVHSGEPMLFDELYDAEKPLSYVLGQSVELTLHSPIQDFDTPTHLLNDIPKRRLRPAGLRGTASDDRHAAKGDLIERARRTRDAVLHRWRVEVEEEGNISNISAS